MKVRTKSKTTDPSQRDFYVFNSDLVLAGDILLTTSPSSLKSAAIRRATHSDFSHAAIATETGMFVEAVGRGVRRFALQRMAVLSRESVRFLRLRSEVPNAKKVREQAGMNAEKYLARRYWLRGALLTIIRDLPLEENSKFFCSHLVAQAYHEAGIDLFDEIEPPKVYPGLLLETSTLLTDVTNLIIIPGPHHRHWKNWDYLDKGDRMTPHDIEVKTMQAAGRRMAKEMAYYDLPRPEDFYESLNALALLDNSSLAAEIDSKFVQILEDEEYFTLLDTAYMPNNQHILRLDHFVRNDIENGHLSTLEQFQTELGHYWSARCSLLDSLKHIQAQRQIWNSVYLAKDLKTFGALVNMQDAIISFNYRLTRTTDTVIAALEDAISKATK